MLVPKSLQQVPSLLHGAQSPGGDTEKKQMIVVTRAQGQDRNVHKELRGEQGRVEGHHCETERWLWTDWVTATSLQQLRAFWTILLPCWLPSPRLHPMLGVAGSSAAVAFSLLTLRLRQGGRREALSPTGRTAGFGDRRSRSRSELWRPCLHLLMCEMQNIVLFR